MFLGHFAVGFAARRWAPKESLALLILAPVLLDVIWPVLVLAGIEHARVVPGDNPFLHLHLDHIPWSHSLVMSVVWGALLGGGWYVWKKSSAGAVALGLGVVSHWLLDWITHRPDMPLWPGGPGYGLMLWSSVPGTLLLEGALWTAGLAIYAGATRPARRRGTWGMASFVALLTVLYLAQLAGAPPPGITLVAVSALIGIAVSLAWVWWFDRNREVRA
jgi:membrane-bound metal-dependent hydrolase YbcI (DUF457 family)